MKKTTVMKTVITVIRLLFLILFGFLIANEKMILWLVVFAVSLVAELVFGRFYCGFVCPMNTLMVPTDWLARKLKIQTKSVPKWLLSGRFMWVTLALSVAAMLLARRLGGINLQILPILLAIAILVTLRFQPMVFHNLICPFGALQKLFAKKPVFSQRVSSQACIGCKMCEKVCPAAAITVSAADKKAHVSDILCHQCTNCQQVCPKSAIRYSKQPGTTTMR